MKILQRFKKREMEGFKEYVTYIELVSRKKRGPKFLNASLEDPVYMSWVAKNILDISHFLDFNSSCIETICQKLSHTSHILLTAFHQTPMEASLLLGLTPNLKRSYEEERQNFQNRHWPIDPSRQEQAQFAIVRTIRQLQEQNECYVFPWRLPPLSVVKINKNIAPNGLFESFFEDGRPALKGELRGHQRTGLWKIFYTTGMILAEGSYSEDKKQGQWTFYYPDGRIREQGCYEEDIKSGVWCEWDRQGQKKIIDYGQGTIADEDHDLEEGGRGE